MDLVEKAMAYAPPFTYSHITGIKSPTGAEAEGWLITVGGTPKELMAHDPEFTYAKLLAAADIARKLGAQVMGLGAFTKVVGDAGVTVAKQASLPITTGNSYSASGALWAAHEAVEREAAARFEPLVDPSRHERLLGTLDEALPVAQGVAISLVGLLPIRSTGPAALLVMLRLAASIWYVRRSPCRVDSTASRNGP